MNRKPVFDAIRQLFRIRLTQSQVDTLDRAFDCAQGDADACAPPCSSANRTVGPAGIALVKRFEGCARLRPDGRYEAYPDPGTGGEPWTIGWGATGRGIGPGTVWTRAQCDTRLERDLARHAAEVAAALDGAPVTQDQFDALVSFHYNTGAIARATLTRRHLVGDYSAALKEFARWKHAGGRELAGLVRRRAAEARLYAGGAAPISSRG